MCINTLETKQDVTEELIEKLKHEKRMERDLRSLFADMGDEFFITVLAISGTPAFNQFSDEMISLIKKNYRQTSRAFKGNIRKELDLGNVESETIDAELRTFINQEAPKRARQIINTTNKVSQSAIDSATDEAIAEGRAPSSAIFTAAATNKFRQMNRDRAAIIALTETQNVSEKSKNVEAAVLSRAGRAKVRKEWNALLDSKTRSSHAAADGQQRQVDQPFMVGGERLMYPGDSSLGASPGNVINCRCSTEFVTTR